MTKDYYPHFTGHIDTAHEVRGLHRRSGDFLNVSEPPVQTLIQLDELEDTIVVNGPAQLRKGEYVKFYRLTRVPLNNNGITDYLIPTGGYEVINDKQRGVDKGRVVHSCDRRACSVDSQ